MNKVLMIFMLAGASSLCLAQDDGRSLRRTIEIGPSGELSISNISGDIRIEATSGDTLTLEATKSVMGPADRDLLDAVEIDISETGDRVRIETRYPHDGDHRHRRHRGNITVDYRLSVPVGTEVEAHSVSGDVTVVGVEGEVSLQSVSGDVLVRDAKRLEEAKSVSGDVEVGSARSDGESEIASISGEVRITDIEVEELSVSSVSGNIRIENASCARGSLSTVSGNLLYSGRIAAGGRYELESHSGNVEISIGDEVGFELEARTFSGRIDSDFDLQGGASRDRGERSLNGLFGDGSAFIEVGTFSGNVELRRQ